MSDFQKKRTLDFIESLKIKQPAKLYLHINNYFMKDFDFELPAPDESTPKAIRKIHISDETCTSCSA